MVELNRAGAVAMRDGPAAGLALVALLLLASGQLGAYHLAHAARAAYRRALDLARQRPERRFLERRLRELE